MPGLDAEQVDNICYTAAADRNFARELLVVLRHNKKLLETETLSYKLFDPVCSFMRLLLRESGQHPR